MAILITLSLFSTDHGPAFPRMKCTLFDGGIGVGFIMYVKDLANGLVFDSMVSHLDLFPTLCELEKLDVPEYLEGKSLLPILEQKTDSIHDELFEEINYHASYQPMRSVRTKRYKYIKYFDSDKTLALSNIDECNSKTFLLDNGLRKYTRVKESLYDLYFDPNEQNNIIQNKEYNSVYLELKAKLDKWMHDTEDPLLHNSYVPRPKDSLVNKHTCENPGVPDWES